MNLQDWLRARKDAVSRELLHLLRADEGGAVGGEDANLLGLDIESVCGEAICEDVISTARYPGRDVSADAQGLHERAKVTLYG